MKNVIIVWENGENKKVPKNSAWEFENDKDWLTTIPLDESPGESEAVEKIREALANYILSEGCSCCEGIDHKAHAERLAELLNVEKFDDGSGYNFFKYKSQP